ncbi:tRNA N(3)-methylcytidine methyltransferase METTL6-like [Paramacrobiotus metropolitanus]|uniref:tRNA N(3)-methylcytidine methyltransferase METTL6-like n=1 Tax=Paramacrobiotus metropolitanus TaxID=2943436 RepID=UPI0024463843|nr:tRNA N(3)-methylcytidine methyltransferase METTL6-like [Paramacrobiotus metropolitanus]
MPSSETKAISAGPSGDTAQTSTTTEEKKPACKACCACPETKKVRDACIVENGEENCQHLIEAHKESLPRDLSPEDFLQLAKHDSRPVTAFKRTQLENDSRKNWDKFYKRNGDKFFKNRHWTTREFEELANLSQTGVRVLEVGCGVGDLVLPLIEANPSVFAYACDFSANAIDVLRKNDNYQLGRIHAFVADIVQDDLRAEIPEPVDIVTMVFVLSAINPQKMAQALSIVRRVLRSGGVILFRDYGIYDHAMIRFAPGQKLNDRFYFRHDGTYSYFFSLEETRRLFEEAGFEAISCDYVFRETSNKKEDICVPRIFVQGKFRLNKNS